MKRLLILLTISLLLQACKWDSPDTRSKPLIVATTSILADAISVIVGDSADVRALMPAGVDPHLYKASVRDLDLLTEADLVIYHGLYLEGKMTEIFEKLEFSQRLINISEELPEEKLLRTGPEAHSVDPHIWFDVKLWTLAMDYSAKELIAWKPEWKDYIQENWSTYQKDLLAADQEIQEKVSKLHAEGMALVTAHDAFAYFGEAYGFEVRGLQGLSTLSEPGLRDLGDLAQFIIDRNIKAVFAEQTISPRALKALVDACEQKGHQIELAGPLFTDSLDAANTPAGTYLGMIKTNLEIIYQALVS